MVKHLKKYEHWVLFSCVDRNNKYNEVCINHTKIYLLMVIN